MKSRRQLFYSFLFSLLASCTLFDKDEQVPAYIRINNIPLTTDVPNEGTNSNKIVDAWVYVNNDLIGAFEMPATIPVLVGDGSHTVRVKAGVKMNGISALRLDYPFYDYFENTFNLSTAQITTISPSVVYRQNTTFAFIENFDGAGTQFNDTIGLLQQDPNNPFEGPKSGHIRLNNDTFAFELQTQNGMALPTDGRPVFLEMNYKCSHSFNVGILTSNYEHRLSLLVNKQEEWNKIYINLTNEVNRAPQSSTVKIYFSMIKPNNMPTADFYIDNVKVLY